MLDLILALLDAVTMWGVFLGLAVAIGLAYIISIILWGEFRVELFVALSVPFVIIGLYIQHKTEKD